MARVVLLALALLVASTARAQNPPQPGFFVDMQFLWFDSPIVTDFHDSQQFNGTLFRDEPGLVEFAPRLIAGYDDVLGARVRWWTFDRATMIHGSGVVSNEQFNFDVIDLEATTHLRRDDFDFLLAGGARLASIERNVVYFEEWQTTHEQGQFGGLTLAGEGRASIYANDTWGASLIGGARLSMLKGGWTGESFSASFRPDWLNDRYTVPELFAGIEAHYGRAFSRLTVEMQDWRGSDIGAFRHDYDLTGFGFDLGWSF
jgi:hypothetical protein